MESTSLLVKKCNCGGQVIDGKLMGRDKKYPEFPECKTCLIQYSYEEFSKLPNYQINSNP